MIKTIKAKEGLKVGDSYINNDLREQMALSIRHELQVHPSHTSDGVLYEVIDELITLIRTATLDEKWIPVSEAFPDRYHPVLVYVNPPMQIFALGEVHYAYFDRGKFRVTSESGNHADFITHWMPLPEPPKVNNDD